MKLKQKNRNFQINREEKNEISLIKENNKMKINDNNGKRIINEINSSDLDYYKKYPPLKNFYERYNDIKIRERQYIPKLEENEKRRKIFIEVSENLNIIKNKQKNNTENG